MKVFLVDFENVHESGLEGINTLTGDDKVIIFHGPIKESVSLSIVESIVKSKADFDFIGTKKTADNYLDFQLSTYLGYFINQNPKADFYIISKDSDYDATIDFWKDNKRLTIHRQPNISGRSYNEELAELVDENIGQVKNSEEFVNSEKIGVAEKIKTELADVLKSYGLSKNILNSIAIITIKSQNRTELHQNLVDTFKDLANINDIYKSLRKVHLQLRQKYLG